MEPQKRQLDDEIQTAFRNLAHYEPRPGYEQRFWARVEASKTLPVAWRWLPVMATALGLIIGVIVADRTQLARPGTPTIGVVGNLPEGSLAAAFTFKAGE
jgi:hypothetical protein